MKKVENTLYLVPTPIGNMEDMTFRAIRILQEVDYIFAEDTRVTKRLLSHFHITYKYLNSYHIYNEAEQVDNIIKLIQEGNSIALCSDAGMPGISDPGYLVTKKAIEEGITVIALPGASAVTTALSASGLPSDTFTFIGFLDHKQTKKEKELLQYINHKETLILYEAPHRLKSTIETLYQVFQNRKVVIAREISKQYEEYIRFSLEDYANMSLELKGEIVILIEGAKEDNKVLELAKLSILEHVEYYKNTGLEEKEAIKQAAKDRNIPKNEVYQVIHKK